MKFVRYGSLVPQYHNISERTYHTAPVENGFYAFPEYYEEPFLLGGIGKGNIANGRYKYVKLPNGKKLYASFSELFDYEDDVVYGYNTFKNPKLKQEYVKLIGNISCDKMFPINDNNSSDKEPFEFPIISEPEDYDIKYHWLIENPKRKFNYNGLIWCHLVDDVKPNNILKRSGSWILVDMPTYQKALKRTIYMQKYNNIREKPGAHPSGYPNSYFSKDWLEVFIEKIN